MLKRPAALLALLFPILLAGCSSSGESVDDKLKRVEHIVVIYGENRSFDNLYGNFPGANGLSKAAANTTQVDRDGSAMSMLPPAWGGIDRAIPQAVAITITNTQCRDNRRA